MNFASKCAVLLACLMGTAHAQWWNPYDNTMLKERGRPGASKVVYTKALFAEAEGAILNAIRVGDFAKVQKMHDEFAKEKLRATDGAWMVESFQRAFDTLFHGTDTSQQKIFEDWKTKFPESKFRSVAEAAMWQRKAWSVRGGQRGANVPAESKQIFDERLKKAQEALDQAGPAGQESPIWHWVALIVAGSTGQSAKVQDALFTEATRRFPGYQPLYFTRMNYLLPQWGGDYDQVDQFVRSATASTAADNGAAFYAWLYVDVASKTSGDDFFRDTRVSWLEMKKAFDDMVARFPDGWNKALYATFACRARDRETTARLLTELGPNVALGAWSSGISTESCRRLAFDKT